LRRRAPHVGVRIAEEEQQLVDDRAGAVAWRHNFNQHIECIIS